MPTPVVYPDLKVPRCVYPNKKDGWCVYILQCKDKSLYCGITTDIERRVDEHNGITKKDAGASYTRPKRPCVLVYVEYVASRSAALIKEDMIKRKGKHQKFAFLAECGSADLLANLVPVK